MIESDQIFIDRPTGEKYHEGSAIGWVMEELTPPPSPFDTYIPGRLSSQAAAVVGAIRAATFEVVPGEHDSYTLHLRHYWPPDEQDPSAQLQATVLQRFIVPMLMDPKDCVLEIPEKQGPGVRRFLLVVMVRDEGGQVRGVGAMVVDCPHRKEAERRLLKFQEMAVG